jgi:uncharacterized protein with gpF-like domain
MKTKEQKKEYDRAYYLTNKKEKKERSRQNYQDNKEQKSQYAKTYYKNNKEELLEYGKQYRVNYYAENHEEILNKQKEHYHSNKEQISKRRSELYFVNVDERREYNRKQYYKHFIKSLVLGMKTRSQKASLEFDVDIEFIQELYEKQSGKCVLTGIDFEIGEGSFRKSYRRPFAPSIDRIDCKQGYTKNNIRIVCVIVNIALNDFGDLIFDKMCEAYVNNKKSKHSVLL